jgi:hypothetical protein
MSAGAYSFVLEQGATFNQSLNWSISGTPVNLNTYTAKMQVRKTAYHTTAVATFTTTDGSITLDASGNITLYKSPADASAIPAGVYVYDLELTSANGTVKRLIEGAFTVNAEVTR